MEIQTEKKGNVHIISVSGMLDASNYLTLEENIQTTIREGAQFLIFNLQKLEYMSSAGVRIFIKTYHSLKSIEGTMVFSSLQPFVLEIFEIAGLTSSFQIYMNDEEALKSLSLP